MSKKLIAVAAAAALALTGLVGIAPASANAYSVTVNGKAGGTGADATVNAITIAVPSQDTIRWSSANVIHSALQFDVTATTSTGAVTATSTGAVKLLTQAQLDDTANTDHKSGSQSLSIAAAGGNAKFYAFTTSTTAGTVTISNAGNTTTYFVRGTSDKGYKLALNNVPASATQNVDFKFTATVTDMFGNPISGITDTHITTTGFGAFDATVTETFVEIASNKGTYNVTVPKAAVTGSGAGILKLVLGTQVYTVVEASFGKTAFEQTLAINSLDPAAQITALTAQVAALQATMAGMRTKALSVTKKKYNKLARKWNAQNRTARVALKK